MSEDCLFCKIAGGEIPGDRVYEDDRVLAFRDISPQAPVHVLIIPRKHIASLDDAGPEDRDLMGDVVMAARRIAEEEGISSAYRLVNNCGAPAGQSVFHIHFHLLGGRAMEWPPG